MCGIAGIVDLNSEPVSPFLLRAMTDAIAHRGPDGEGHWIEQNIGIGHRRLSILDLSTAGHQPMVSVGGRYVLSYNGELYNFREIRATLEEIGHVFRSNTDSEVVLSALVEWGTSALLRFNGMFAIALWDRRTSTLLLARDRYGIKPLYYANQGNRFYFGSEQKAILADERYRRDLNKQALLEYFTFQNIFTANTFYSDIYMLEAGHFGTLDGKTGDWRTTQYWDFNFVEPTVIKDEREYEEELNRLFHQAVNRQLVSDVEIGVYLSGGIDSGSIAAVASREIPNLKTFTVGFDLGSASGMELGFDERPQAEAMSSQFKTEQYEMVLKSGDMERCVPQLVHHLEEPRVGQSYPNFYAAKLASKFVKVVLSGSGGDELFAGYPWRYQTAGASTTFDGFIDSYFASWQRLMSDSELKRLFSPIWKDVESLNTKEIFRDVFRPIVDRGAAQDNYLNLSLYFEAKTFLHGLLVVEDKLSMAHGLETRVPFLDNDLVDFAMSIPTSLKLSRPGRMTKPDENRLGEKIRAKKQLESSGKRLLRSALHTLHTPDVLSRRKKGFSSPDASWFKGESLDYVGRVLGEVPSGGSVLAGLNQDALVELIQEHTSGKRNRRLMVWAAIHCAHINL